MKLKKLSQLLWGVYLLLVSTNLDATASCVGLSLQDAGGGVYRVVAKDLVNVGAIDLTLTYDKASLSKPKVARGDLASWLVFMPNIVEASGTVRVAMVNEPPVSGSGTVATVTFTPLGKSWVKPALTCQLTSLDASNQSVGSTNNQERITDEGEGSSDEDQGSDSQDTMQSDITEQGGGSSQQDPGHVGETSQPEQPRTPSTDLANGTTNPIPHVSPGTINLGVVGSVVEQQAPLEQAPPLEQEPAAPTMGEQPAQWEPSPEIAEDMIEEGESPAETTSPPHSAPIPIVGTTVPDSKYTIYGGVLERFKNYAGERSPKALVALFDQPVAALIKQDPPICISDGKMMLTVLIDLPESGSTAPNFALRGASLKSLKKQGDNRWMIEAAPDAGRVDATLTIVNGDKVADYPFTVAPRVDANVDRKGATDDADFSLFLSTSGTDKALAYDLNGDGRRDYVDDYIYTANYLVAGGGKGDKKK